MLHNPITSRRRSLPRLSFPPATLNPFHLARFYHLLLCSLLIFRRILAAAADSVHTQDRRSVHFPTVFYVSLLLVQQALNIPSLGIDCWKRLILFGGLARVITIDAFDEKHEATTVEDE